MQNWVSKVVTLKAGESKQIRVDHPTNPIVIKAITGTISSVITGAEGETLDAPVVTSSVYYTPGTNKAWGTYIVITASTDSVVLVIKST